MQIGAHTRIQTKIPQLPVVHVFHRRPPFAKVSIEHCQDSRWRMNIEILIVPTGCDSAMGGLARYNLNFLN